MTTEEFRARLDDPATAIVDTRPLHAFNGWRVDGAPRGGHIAGAIAFPTEWLDSLDDEDVREILATKGISHEVVRHPQHCDWAVLPVSPHVGDQH